MSMSYSDLADVYIAETPEDFVKEFAESFIAWGNAAIDARGEFAIALTGGNTPRPLYAELNLLPYRAALDWEKVRIFFGDERTVPPHDPASNHRMAMESWLRGSGILPDHIHRMHGEAADLDAAAAEYALLLEKHLPIENGAPSFDLVLLGMGDDGHTASLFPGTAALQEQGKFVVANSVPQLQTQRLTLTYPTINAAQEVWVLANGESKAGRVAQVFGKQPGGEDLPIRNVMPTTRRLRWILDEAAGHSLIWE